MMSYKTHPLFFTTIVLTIVFLQQLCPEIQGTNQKKLVQETAAYIDVREH
jgi:hypothetical protein